MTHGAPGRSGTRGGRFAVAASLLGAVLLLPGCSGQAEPAPPPRTGPANVVPAAVQLRARWFDTRDPSRPAGSDGELVAGSYLLARLERAGYVVNLDPVPVGDLLHSTNVIALPPSGTVSTAVVVEYDTSASAPSDGLALGTFLELARALRTSDPQHSVGFAALGAEHTTVNGGQVGSRSLVELLKARHPQPQIVRIGRIRRGSSVVTLSGPAAPSMRRAAPSRLRVHVAGFLPDDVFTRAGFAETVVQGSLAAGPLLLAYLASSS